MRNSRRSLGGNLLCRAAPLTLFLATVGLFGQETSQPLPEGQQGSACGDVGNRAIRIDPAQVRSLIRARTPIPVPDRLHDSALKGEVRIEVLLDERGTLCSVEAVAGNPFAVSAVMRVVPTWTFKPYAVGGVRKAVRAQLGVRYDFTGARRKGNMSQ